MIERPDAPAPPEGVDLQHIRMAVASRPLDAISYLTFISPLVGGAAAEDRSAPVVTIVDRILLMAIQQGADEVRFEAGRDDDLVVRLRRGEEWTALPSLSFAASVRSRLLVLGGLEKGQEARAQVQTGSTTLYGAQISMTTEPIGPLRENIRVRIGPAA